MLHVETTLTPSEALTKGVPGIKLCRGLYLVENTHDAGEPDAPAYTGCALGAVAVGLGIADEYQRVDDSLPDILDRVWPDPMPGPPARAWHGESSTVAQWIEHLWEHECWNITAIIHDLQARGL